MVFFKKVVVIFEFKGKKLISKLLFKNNYFYDVWFCKKKKNSNIEEDNVFFVIIFRICFKKM